MARKESIDDLVNAIEKLKGTFKIESYLYLIYCGLAILFLVIVIINQYNEGKWEKSLVLLAPTGTFAFFSNKVLKMWDDAIALVKTHIEKNS